MNKYIEQAEKIFDEAVKNRRYLHQNPEIGLECDCTAAFVMEKLQEYGCDPKLLCEGCVTATVGDPDKGKVIMLRADMDALPMAEDNDLPFKSTNGYTHSCGHDIHTAMLLGAAKILKEHEDELKGAVKFMFQPAEETLKGAERMIENGLLDNPKVDAAFGMHVAADYPVNTYSTRAKYVMAAATEFQIDITGKSCHGGAFIHMGIDPINVGVHIHLALQELIAREVKTLEPAVLSVGAFVAGSTSNTIPATAMMKGTIRSYSNEVQGLLLRRVKEVVEHTAAAFNATATVTFISDIPSLYNTPEMLELLQELSADFNDEIVFTDRQSLGCDDFALVGQHVPILFVHVGAALADPAKRYPLHNPKIVFDENCMKIGIASHVAMAMTWLDRNS